MTALTGSQGTPSCHGILVEHHSKLRTQQQLYTLFLKYQKNVTFIKHFHINIPAFFLHLHREVRAVQLEAPEWLACTPWVFTQLISPLLLLWCLGGSWGARVACLTKKEAQLPALQMGGGCSQESGECCACSRVSQAEKACVAGRERESSFLSARMGGTGQLGSTLLPVTHTASPPPAGRHQAAYAVGDGLTAQHVWLSGGWGINWAMCMVERGWSLGSLNNWERVRKSGFLCCPGRQEHYTANAVGEPADPPAWHAAHRSVACVGWQPLAAKKLDSPAIK